MISTRICVALALAFAFVSFSAVPSFADSIKSQVVDRELTSKNFTNSKVGISPVRKMIVYLPAGYEGSSKHYPVIYFLPDPFDGSYRFVFDQRDAQGLFDQATAAGVIEKFILVLVDMDTPLGSS